MEYIVLDLEMCQVKGCDCRRYPYKNEIIQIGAVKLNEQFEVIDEFNRYIRPQFGAISKYIQNLTGIYNGKVKNADCLCDVMSEFVSWCGTEDVKYVTWSNSDYGQFSREIKAKSIDFADLEAFMNLEKWVDYQKVFGDRYHFDRCVKLSEALYLAEIDSEGRSHDGLCDAYNTAKLFAALELDPEYPLIPDMKTEYTDSESSGFTLGDLLMQKFNVSLAS